MLLVVEVAVVTEAPRLLGELVSMRVQLVNSLPAKKQFTICIEILILESKKKYSTVI